MRVAIAGAGAVGRSIARELLDNGHEVLLIDKNPRSIKVDSLPRAEWLLADAAEITSLDEAGLERCNVVICATGDDKVNLVVSLLAKTEYGVPRVVARINHPNNEWLFNESWGVDVAVSTPRLLSALVEEAVSVGDLVRLMTFRQSEASLVELTMPDDAPLAGSRIGDISWPADTALVAILRAGRVIVPQADDPLAGGRRTAVRDQRGRRGRTGQAAGRALTPPGQCPSSYRGLYITGRPRCSARVPSTVTARPGSIPAMWVRPSQMTVTAPGPPPSSARSIGGAPGAPARTRLSDPVIRTRGRAPTLPVVSTAPRYRSRVNCGSPISPQMLQNGNTRRWRDFAACRGSAAASRHRPPGAAPAGRLARLGDLRAALERI